MAWNRESDHTKGTCVIGLGRIGLPLALLLARDRNVIGVDIDEDHVDSLQAGELPFSEPGLETLFDAAGDSFEAHTEIPDDSQETYVIVTPTPLEPETRVADLSAVRGAAEAVANVLTPGNMVVLESTVPPGTSKQVVIPTLAEELDPAEFGYAHCPERALPGNTVEEMVTNHRVIGATDGTSLNDARDLYSFVEGSIHPTDPTTAEFVKLIENTYRDVNIAAANEFAKLAERNGIDGRSAIDLANKHPRVNILTPGPGVGGHCLPIDPQFLTQLTNESRMIGVAREINSSMPAHTLGLVRELLDGEPNRRLTVLGVAYKGDVSDIRETPASRFYRLARNEGYDVRLHDPHVEEYEYELSPFEEAVEGSDCLVVLADHTEYHRLPVERIGELMRGAAIIDTRGLIQERRWTDAGFRIRILGDGRQARGFDATRLHEQQPES